MSKTFDSRIMPYIVALFPLTLFLIHDRAKVMSIDAAIDKTVDDMCRIIKRQTAPKDGALSGSTYDDIKKEYGL